MADMDIGIREFVYLRDCANVGSVSEKILAEGNVQGDATRQWRR